MTAPFGMTPETGGKSVGPSPNASPVARSGSPYVHSVDTSLDLSDHDIQLSTGYSPDIRKTDEALTTLLKMQLVAMEEQLEESRRQHEEAQKQFQAREHDLEGKLIDLARQHQSEMNAQRLVAQSQHAQLEVKSSESHSHKTACPGKQGATMAWQHAKEMAQRELDAITERRETLQLLLASLNLG